MRADSIFQIDTQALAVSMLAGISAHSVDLISTQWVGVPLNVVVAAFAGAMFSLSWLGPIGLCRALLIVFGSTAVGSIAQPWVALLLNAQQFPLPVAALLGSLLHVVGQIVASNETRQRLFAVVDLLISRIGGNRP